MAQVLVQQQATHLSQPQQAATTVLPSFTSVEADMALQVSSIPDRMAGGSRGEPQLAESCNEGGRRELRCLCAIFGSGKDGPTLEPFLFNNAMLKSIPEIQLQMRSWILGFPHSLCSIATHMLTQKLHACVSVT
eukprot:1142912-Pelagomonas_calceolata.AAC.18